MRAHASAFPAMCSRCSMGSYVPLRAVTCRYMLSPYEAVTCRYIQPLRTAVAFSRYVPLQVLAVLDWELSTLGHPGADLALLTLPYDAPATLPKLTGFGDACLADEGIPSEQVERRVTVPSEQVDRRVTACDGI